MNKKHAILLAAIIILSACTTSTHITSSWVKQDKDLPAYHNIMVIAMVNGISTNLQKKMEEAVVTEIRSRGYQASSYYNVYGSAVPDKSDEQAAITKLRKDGADAILTITLLDTTNEHYFVPPSVSYYPYDAFYNRFWGYYVTRYDRVYSPGYYTTDHRFFWESNLYRAESQDLIYSVRTESFDPKSSDELAQDYARKIVRDMVHKELLERQ